MLGKLGVDEEAGEDVGNRRAALQDLITSEIEKYGHPANNPKLKRSAKTSQAFGLYLNAVGRDGEFSALLSGNLDKTAAAGYDSQNVESIVAYLRQKDGDQVEFEDVKELYKGSAPLQSAADLCEFEDIAITPDGMLETMSFYCSGNLPAKMADLRMAIGQTEDARLKDKYQKQIDRMDSLIKRVELEDITFGLQHKWFGRKYVLEFLQQNGYPNAVYGREVEVEEEDYAGNKIYRRKFVENPDDPDGMFMLNANRDGGLGKFLEKHLNGENVKASKKDWRGQIALVESSFDAWMKGHVDALVSMCIQF